MVSFAAFEPEMPLAAPAAAAPAAPAMAEHANNAVVAANDTAPRLPLELLVPIGENLGTGTKALHKLCRVSKAVYNVLAPVRCRSFPGDTRAGPHRGKRLRRRIAVWIEKNQFKFARHFKLVFFYDAATDLRIFTQVLELCSTAISASITFETGLTAEIQRAILVNLPGLSDLSLSLSSFPADLEWDLALVRKISAFTAAGHNDILQSMAKVPGFAPRKVVVPSVGWSDLGRCDKAWTEIGKLPSVEEVALCVIGSDKLAEHPPRDNEAPRDRSRTHVAAGRSPLHGHTEGRHGQAGEAGDGGIRGAHDRVAGPRSARPLRVPGRQAPDRERQSWVMRGRDVGRGRNRRTPEIKAEERAGSWRREIFAIASPRSRRTSSGGALT